jgi:tetratricopeptide (TPR) repeat protein
MSTTRRVRSAQVAVLAGWMLLMGAAWPLAAQELSRLRAAVVNGSARPGDLIAEIQKVLADQPDSAEAHLLLGLAYRLAGPDMLPSTIAELRQALAIAPGLAEARLELARAYIALRRPDRAREELETALAGMPTRPAEFLIALADAERQTGAPERALEVAREVPASDREGPQARYQAALALIALGRNGEAITELERLLSLRPVPLEVTAALGSVYLDEGRPADAIPLLEDTVAAVPNRPDLHVSLARALRQAGRPDDALARLALALPEWAPREASEFYETTEADISLERGIIYLGQNRLDEADAALASALALRPDDGTTHRYLAELRLRQDRKSDAVTHAGRAREAGIELPADLAVLIDGQQD